MLVCHHFHFAGSPPQSPSTLAKRVKIFLPVSLVNIQPLAVPVDKLFDSLARISVVGTPSYWYFKTIKSIDSKRIIAYSNGTYLQ